MTDEADPTAPGCAAWKHAVAIATSAPELTEALSGIVAHAAPATGAHSAAVADLRSASCRAVWRCREADIAPLLREGGPLAEALARDAGWPLAPVLYSPGNGDGSDAGLVVAPLRVREVTNGALLLFFRSGWPPAPPRQDAAAALSGLLALALENHLLYNDARTARQARDHFLSALHHELRTPATALMLETGVVQAGMYGELPSKLQQALERLEGHAAQLIQVAGRVLDLGWLEAGDRASAKELVDPRQQVVEVLRIVEPSTKRKGLQLTVFLPRSLPLLQTDRERFSRILLHLLSNAIKYTDKGGIEVRLERRTGLSGTRQKTQLAVRVTDTGRGIPPEELDRIFEPFAQVEEGARTDSPHRGVGLGLPLARKLARSLGGDVEVEGGEEGGTTATLVLPYPKSGAT